MSSGRLQLLEESEQLLFVAKPSGWVVHRGFSGDEWTVLSELRQMGYRELHPAHRLDRGTSGVLVIAKTVEMARELQQAFAEEKVHKLYWAVVRGLPAEPNFDVDHAIPCDEGGPRVPARTLGKLLSTTVLSDSPLREKRYSLMAAEPKTGRFHQVRRHLKHLGHPVLGDTTYGRSEHNALLRERCGLERLALHARSIELQLRSGTVRVEAPLPEDLSMPMRRLGLEWPAS